MAMEELEAEMARTPKVKKAKVKLRSSGASGKGPRIHYGLDTIKTATQPVWNMSSKWDARDRDKAIKSIRETWEKRNVTGVIPPVHFLTTLSI